MPPTRTFSELPAAGLPESGGILVADAQPLFRCGLRHLLAHSFPAHPLREARTAAELTELVSRQPPALVIMAANLPDAFAEPHRVLTALREIRPRVAVIVLLEAATATELTLLRLTRQRINGLLPRTAPPPEVGEAVATVLQHGQYHDRFTRGRLHRPLPAGVPPPPGIFSPRQLQVLRLIADDHSNEDIAEYLGTSVRTVEYHRSQMLHKTGARTTLALVLLAQRQGLLSLGPDEPGGAAVCLRRAARLS